MPRQIKERIDPTNAAVRESSPVGSTVAARPSGPQGAPTVFDPGMDIARALSSINPALQRYIGERAKENEDADLMSGRKARLEQKDQFARPMTREQSPAWQKGYMEMHGRMSGIVDSTDIEAFYNENKHKMSAEEFEEYLGEQRKSRLAGFEDPDALREYMPQIVQTENKLRDDFARVQVQKARLQEREYVNLAIGKHISDSRELSTEEAVGQREVLAEDARKRGITRPEFNALYVNTLVSDPKASPADFQPLFVKGPDGIAPADALGPDGSPLRDQINRALAVAEHREELRFKEKQKEYADGIKSWTANILMKDDHPDDSDGPLAIKDPYQFVYSQTYKGGPFDGPGEAATALKAILKAQDDQREAIHIRELFNSFAPVPAALQDHKVFKKLQQQAYENVWKGVEWGNTQDVTKRMQASISLQEKYGGVDPFLKSIGESAHIYGTVKDDKGNERLSPNLAAALAIRRGLKNSSNSGPIHNIFSEKSEAFLEVLETNLRAGAPEIEAYRTAKKVIEADPAVRKQMWTPQERAANVQKASKQFENWFANKGNGYFPTVNNKEFIGNLIVRQAENIYVAGNGAISKDRALELATERVVQTSAYDGHQTMFQIPADVSKEHAAKVFPQFVQSAKDAYKAKTGTDLQDYVVAMQQMNGRPVWVVQDALGRNLTTAKDLTEIEQDWRKANQKTFEDAVKANPMRPGASTAVDIAIGRNMTDLNLGRINAREYERRSAELKAQQRKLQDEQAASMNLRRSQVPNLPPPNLSGQDLRIRVPEPIGPEMKPKEAALTHVNTNPSFALAVAGEGFRNTVYLDSRGKRTIGLGYNLDARPEEQVRKEFARIGITDPERQGRIMEGKEAITVDEGVRLYELIKPEYEKRAKNLVGSAWDALNAFQRAVLTDLSYQSGTQAFKDVWAKLSTGDAKGATDVLSKAMGGNAKGAARRMNLRLALWESPARFIQLIEQGI